MDARQRGDVAMLADRFNLRWSGRKARTRSVAFGVEAEIVKRIA